jgi:hypothetical protein
VKELTDSYDVISDTAALRTRLATDGYLFFRGLLPVDVVTAVHEQLARILYDSNWLDRDPVPCRVPRSRRGAVSHTLGPTRTIRSGVRRRTGRATYCCSGV